MRFYFHVQVLHSCSPERGAVLKEQRSRKKPPTQNRGYSSRRHSCNDGSKLKGHVDEAAELMRKVANGDIEAFERIYSKFCPILRSFLADYNSHYISSDDFIQEVFTRLWQRRKSFRGESIFLTYLLGIAKHTLNEKMRQYHKMVRIKKLKQVTRFNVDSNGDGLSQPEAEFYLNELNVTLERIRALLTAEQRQALEVSQTVDVSLAEASQKLGCSRETFRCRLKRARKRTRELLAPILECE